MMFEGVEISGQSLRELSTMFELWTLEDLRSRINRGLFVVNLESRQNKARRIAIT
jgi:hypothetical protein